MVECREAKLDDRNQMGHHVVTCGHELDTILYDCHSVKC